MVKVIYPKTKILVRLFHQLNIGEFFLENETKQLYMKTSTETAIPIISGGSLSKCFEKCFEEDDYCYPVDVEIKVLFKKE